MKVLTQEIRNVQNPALGAGLLWRFACGYTENHPERAAAPLPLVFLVLPIVLHERTESFVAGTQRSSGLRAFAAKFGKSENMVQDLLLAIHDRSLELRGLSQESLRIAIATRLLHLDMDGTVTPLSHTDAIAGVPESLRRLMKSAEKFGAWCSQLTVHEVTTTLKVRL